MEWLKGDCSGQRRQAWITMLPYNVLPLNTPMGIDWEVGRKQGKRKGVDENEEWNDFENTGCNEKKK